jgi:hypothetical protein
MRTPMIPTLEEQAVDTLKRMVVDGGMNLIVTMIQQGYNEECAFLTLRIEGRPQGGALGTRTALTRMVQDAE